VDPLPRWLAYLAMLLVIGASVFRFGVLRPLERRSGTPQPRPALRAAAVGLAAAIVAALMAPIRLWFQARGFTEPGEPVTSELLGIVLDTAWGKGWIVQILAAGLAASGAFFARVTPAGWYFAAAGASAVVLSAPLTGHALGAEQAGAWGYPLDALHVLGAGAWLGTLGVLMIAGVAGSRDQPEPARGPWVANLVQTFHPVALYGSGITVLAGVGLSIRYLEGSLSGLWTSGWGRTLLVKLALLLCIVILGAWNARVMRPGLGTTVTTGRFARSALLELSLTTLLLGVTALLVVQGLPGED
jgi:putative copper export protein